jgi:anthranilate/para-aminobenzoate synthase component II
MILLIDNYDSFVYNLARYVQELGEQPLVRRHDAIGVDEIFALHPSHVIISPGPCSPTEAGISTEVIGAAYGGEIVRAGFPMHGKTSRIHHTGTGIFAGLPNPFTATRYHSLVIAPASVPPSLLVTATSDDGEIMGVQHREHPVHGVQFHPESVLTEQGYRLLDHFLHGVPVTPRAVPGAADGALAPAHQPTSQLAAAPPPVDLVR